MKNIGTLVLISLIFTTLPTYAANFDSSYTSIAEADCKTTVSSERESMQSCQAFENIEVNTFDFCKKDHLCLTDKLSGNTFKYIKK